MKIKILWHSKQNISPELFKDIRISRSELPDFDTVVCAALNDISDEEIAVFKSFEYVLNNVS